MAEQEDVQIMAEQEDVHFDRSNCQMVLREDVCIIRGGSWAQHVDYFIMYGYLHFHSFYSPKVLY